MTLKKFKLQSGLRKSLGQAPISKLEITLGDFSVLNDIGAVKNTETAIGKAAKFKGNVIDIKLGPWVGTGSGKKAKAKGKPKAKAPLKPKKPRPSIIARLLRSTAKKGLKRAARPKTILKQLRKVGLKRNARTILGVGSRKRVIPRSATVRAGIRSLRGGSKAFASFVALRYSPEAIAKYNDYGRRFAKSRRLIKRIVVIDAATYRIGKHLILTDTTGNNPYSCTCPDFSQFSDEDRTWAGSAAGPFNPCKHMMAVRDRNSGGGGSGFFVCTGGSCAFDSDATEGFNSLAACKALVKPPFIGGQCVDVQYEFRVFWRQITIETYPDIPIGTVIDSGYRIFNCVIGGLDNKSGSVVKIYGPIGQPVSIDGNTRYIEFDCHNNLGVLVQRQITIGYPAIPVEVKVRINAIATRCDGLPDTCGNLPSICDMPFFKAGCTDPTANNYDPAATDRDETCTYD
jgi:hypothetical protein